jgi:exopolysaccharide biosynthesis polyprenyl glycosylphosphotransferase
MVRPGMDTIGAEGTVGSGLAASGSLRPRGRWRLMSGHDRIARAHTSTSVHAAGSPRVVLVGKRRDTRRLIRRLGDHPWRGPTVVGYVDAGHGRRATLRPHHRHLALHPETDPVPVLGSIDHLDELVDRARATHVVVAVSGKPGRLARPLEAQLINSDVAVHWVFLDSGRPDLSALANPAAAGPPAVNTANRPLALSWLSAAAALDWPRLAKRLIDLVIAAIALLLLAPLFAAVAVAIWLTSGRPIFYTQARVGQGGRLFNIIKFRSMRRDAESETGPIWASDHDTRCTRIGDWLRHANIDELPQLLNVLKGDMSLVGPRPERPTFVDEFRVTIADYNLRHAVPGGMTGWAQVHGWRGRTSLRKRLQYDLDYIERWSVGLDLRILLMTVQHVFWGKTSWKDSNRPLKALN